MLIQSFIYSLIHIPIHLFINLVIYLSIHFFQLKELRSREELDPPIPDLTNRILKQAEEDWMILTKITQFWKV